VWLGAGGGGTSGPQPPCPSALKHTDNNAQHYFVLALFQNNNCGSLVSLLLEWNELNMGRGGGGTRATLSSIPQTYCKQRVTLPQSLPCPDTFVMEA